MKSFFISLLGLILMSSAFAENAQLRIKISDPTHDNRYFICMNSVGGCVSIAAGDRGKVYPINTGEIQYIAAIDMANRSMHAQPLPQSCRVNVNNSQTVTVTGEISEDNNHNPYVRDMRCSIT